MNYGGRGINIPYKGNGKKGIFIWFTYFCTT